MRNDKSFRSMIFVIAISVVMIGIAIVNLFYPISGNIVLSISTIVFLAPTLLYSLLLYKINIKRKEEYKKMKFKEDSYFHDPLPSPTLEYFNSNKQKNNQPSNEKIEIFIERE